MFFSSLIVSSYQTKLMKKVLLTLTAFILGSIVMNFNSYAGCETALTGQLIACFGAHQINSVTVTVVGTTATIGGTCTTAQVPEATACVQEYEAAAASCPGAPSLMFTVVITDSEGHPKGKARV